MNRLLLTHWMHARFHLTLHQGVGSPVQPHMHDRTAQIDEHGCCPNMLFSITDGSRASGVTAMSMKGSEESSAWLVTVRDEPRAALFASLHGHRRNAARPRSIGNRKQHIRATSMFVDLSGSIMHVRLDGRPDALMQR